MSQDVATSKSSPETVIQAILERLDEKPTLSRYIAAARSLEALHHSEPGLLRPESVLVIRNFTIEPIEPLLKVAGARAGMHVNLTYSGYDPVPGTLDDLLMKGPDAVIIALRLEELAPALARDFLATDRSLATELGEEVIEQILSLVAAVRTRTPVPVLVHNFVPPRFPAAGLTDSQDPAGQLNLVRRMNVALAERVLTLNGAHIVDVEHLFALSGLVASHDDRGDRVGDAPLSPAGLRALAEFQVRHLRALAEPAVKCVILDCDNTLWGGIVGEDGLAGIVLSETGEGRRYFDFQQCLLNLRRRGTLLALCSKNEGSDVLAVLNNHPYCALSESDFAAFRINWDDKAESILSIANELGLALGHFAFIDDNPVECEWIRARLPEVRVIQWGRDIDTGDMLDGTGLFDSFVVTDEDRMRTEMYRAESRRRAARESAADHDEYLRSLDMAITMGLAGPEHLARLAQLTQRTNQFNLTTIRYDVASLEDVLRDRAARIVWLEFSDRFGAHGVVGCAILRHEGDTARIDTLLLSCRVLGRGVETVLVRQLATLAKGMGATFLDGQFNPSERNSQVADLYARLGFDGPEVADGGQRWRLPLASGGVTIPDWFTVTAIGES